MPGLNSDSHCGKMTLPINIPQVNLERTEHLLLGTRRGIIKAIGPVSVWQKS